MSRRRLADRAPLGRSGTARDSGWHPSDICHTVTVVDDASHEVMRFERLIGSVLRSTTSAIPGATVYRTPPPNVIAMADDAWSSLAFYCKTCRDRGSAWDGFVGVTVLAAVEAKLDRMAAEFGLDGDTPRTTSLRLASPDSIYFQ